MDQATLATSSTQIMELGLIHCRSDLLQDNGAAAL
jgi:hypothetical protein